MKAKFKILSLFLTLCMLFALTIPSYASDVQTITVDGKTISTEILVDNDSVRKVKVTEGDKIYVTTYDKKANKVEMVETDNLTNKSKTTVTNLKNVASKSKIKEETVSASALYRSGSIFDGSYYIDGTTWIIENSDNVEKYRTENSSNSSNLTSFKTAIDNMVRAEVAAIAAGGTALTATVYAALTAPTGLGAVVSIVTALGGSFTFAYQLWLAWDYQDDADFYWGRV